MICAWWALAVMTVAILGGDLINRRVYGWLPEDRPRKGRKQHQRPIPLAGVLLVVAMLPWLVADRAWYATAAVLVVAAIGFVDDWHKERDDAIEDPGLDWRIKALALLSAAAAIASTAFSYQQPWLWLGAFALAFVLTNAINFLDNTDGVTAAIAATILLVIGFATDAPSWILASGLAAAAFLPWNWPRPRLFLGDAGAYTLGVACSYVAVQALHEAPLRTLCVAVPLLDFTQVVIARVILAVPPWVGDRRHLTHIAQNIGLPRVAVAPLFAALCGGACWFGLHLAGR